MYSCLEYSLCRYSISKIIPLLLSAMKKAVAGPVACIRRIPDGNETICKRRCGLNLDPLRPDLTIGVVGAGAMGRGIAQVAAVGGLRVLLTDTRLEVAREALKLIGKMIKRSAEKGALSVEDAQAAIARDRKSTRLNSSP